MNIIFLDIDGVLNSHIDILLGKHDPSLEIKPENHGFIGIFKRPTVVLNELIAATDAKIVLSSTWRMIYSTHEMENLLRVAGCPNAEIIGSTPILHDEIRGVEIEQWLKNNTANLPLTNYVIIDDDNDMLDYQLKDSFVYTSHYSGLTPKEGVEAAEILKGGGNWAASDMHEYMVTKSLDVLSEYWRK